MKGNSLQLGVCGVLALSLQTYADIGQVVTEPTVKKTTVEASPNEFPRTVGTIRNEHSGFELSWNNTSPGVSNFFDSVTSTLCRLDFFGLFRGCQDNRVCRDLQMALSVEPKEQDKLSEIAELSHHHESVDIQSADNMPVVADKALAANEVVQSTPEAKDKVADGKYLDDSSLATNNTLAAKEGDSDPDWRKSRQWWQRGTPVL